MIVSVPLLVGLSAAGTVLLISKAVDRENTAGEPPIFSDSAGPAPSAATATPSPSASVEPPKVGEFGATVQLDVVNVTVYQYRPQDARGGEQLGSLEIRTCNTSADTLSVGPDAWSLDLGDGTIVDASQVREGSASPDYPLANRQLRPDNCVRGWLTFELADGRTARSVRYAPAPVDPPADAPVTPAVTWKIPEG